MKIKINPGVWAEQNEQTFKNKFEKIIMFLGIIIFANAIVHITNNNITLTIINFFIVVIVMIILFAKNSYDRGKNE